MMDRLFRYLFPAPKSVEDMEKDPRLGELRQAQSRFDASSRIASRTARANGIAAQAIHDEITERVRCREDRALIVAEEAARLVHRRH